MAGLLMLLPVDVSPVPVLLVAAIKGRESRQVNPAMANLELIFLFIFEASWSKITDGCRQSCQQL